MSTDIKHCSDFCPACKYYEDCKEGIQNEVVYNWRLNK